jgi:hypothetical protein
MCYGRESFLHFMYIWQVAHCITCTAEKWMSHFVTCLSMEQVNFSCTCMFTLPGSPMNKAKIANHERQVQRLQIQDNAACGETSLNRVSISMGKGGSETADLGVWSPRNQLPGR